MVDQLEPDLAETRQLVRDLRALGAIAAPAQVSSTVLERLGLLDVYFEVTTPLGGVFVAYNRSGVCAVMKATSGQRFEDAFRALHDRTICPASEPPAHLRRAIGEQLEGIAHPELRFDLRQLSEFEREVLLKALEIPHGEVRPYAWIAREIGHPAAMRAVGTALANNPVPLLIPCHRVIKSDGFLGMYSLGGADAKRTILRAEGINPDALEALARTGVRFYGNGATHFYCFPTCHFASQPGDPHHVQFGSAQQAVHAGYRPCHACRPAQAS